MATKSFTLSSIKIFKNLPMFGVDSIMLIMLPIRLKLEERHEESVEINHNPN